MKPNFPLFPSGALCGGKYVLLEDLATNEPFIFRAQGSGFGGCRGKHFEILGQDFATTAAAFSVLDGVEERLQTIVGAGYQRNPSAYMPEKANGVSPQVRAMTIQVGQDQVDGLPRVFGRPALGTLPA
jgi:hypothetical protein